MSSLDRDLNVVKGQKTLADSAVELPLTVQTSVQTTQEEFATAEGRRRLRLAVFNERFLTPERRKVLVFLALILLAVGYLLSEVAIRAVAPGLLAAKRQADLVFFYSIATRLILPTPWEPILLAAVPRLGLAPAMFFAAVGGVVGCWLLFLLGAQAAQGLHRLAANRPWLARVLAWMERSGPRYGYAVLFALMAIPFQMDTIAALASIFRLRLGWFMIVIFCSTLLRAFLFITLFV